MQVALNLLRGGDVEAYRSDSEALLMRRRSLNVLVQNIQTGIHSEGECAPCHPARISRQPAALRVAPCSVQLNLAIASACIYLKPCNARIYHTH